MFFGKADPGAVSFSTGEASTLGDIFSAELDAADKVHNAFARDSAREAAYDAHIKRVEGATGVRLENPMRVLLDPVPGIEAPAMRDPTATARFGDELHKLATQHPDQRAIIDPERNFLEDAKDVSRRALARSDDVRARASGSFLPTVAAVSGGMAGSLADPLNAATLFLGPSGTVGTGAKAVIWNGVKQGAANAAAEVASLPLVSAWRKEAGIEMTASEATANVAGAFVLGFGVDAGVRGLTRGARGLRGDRAVLDQTGGVTGWKTPAQQLDDAAKRLPEGDLVRRAAEGDVVALKELSAKTGADLEPAVKGAIAALDDDLALAHRTGLIDEFDADAKLLQALRAAEEPGEIAPRAADPLPSSRVPSLADDQPQPLQSFAIEGKPVTFRDVDLKQTIADPDTFQFKGGGDAAGVTGRLSGVERWDPIAAGRAVIFERNDGALVIADAHQRRGLALALKDQETRAGAFIFREADGWTPGDVRALAAKKNLQEGSGSIVDAARIMRERPDIIDRSVPLGSEAMRQARSLSRLSDDAFADTVAGLVPPHYAALVGDLVEDRARHGSILRELATGDPSNVREARFMISDILQAETIHETQLSLLGAETVSRSLLPERAKVLDSAVKSMREDHRLFNLLTRERERIQAAGNKLTKSNADHALEAAAVQAAIEQLAATRGKVSTWLTDAARDVATGEKSPKQAADAFAARVRDTLERDGIKGLAAEPETVRSGGFDEPGGIEAQRQIDELERELKAEIDAVSARDGDPRRQSAEFPGFAFEFHDANKTKDFGVLAEACKL